MLLSWNEIRKRAIDFSRDWTDESRERAEAQTFWNEFFNVFGISRRRVATFDAPAKKLDNKRGWIDLFWPGTMMVEAKSRDLNLDKAYEQALSYTYGLKEEDVPRYIVVSDFAKIRIYDLENGDIHEFEVSNLYENIKLFGFIAGYSRVIVEPEDPANAKAAKLMGELYDDLLVAGYQGNDLDIFLIRVLFCLFADDTGIFEKGIFEDYIRLKTKEDGSNSDGQLGSLFQSLNTPIELRPTTLDDDLKAFPYVDGELFKDKISLVAFNSKMRDSLLKCCHFDWSKISPAIFGSLFQSIKKKEWRRNLGGHYTSEKNILKVIKSLFLDGLYTELNSIKNNKKALEIFHQKIASLKFLDPACGCGNFLVITYRELRLLEIEVLKALYKKEISAGQNTLDISMQIKLDVDSFYGIEIDDYPAKIAEVALWLVDHQMNMRVHEELGQYFIRIPLNKVANIHVKNALRCDWETIIPKNELSYILGNPPFVGKQLQSNEQKKDLSFIFRDVKSAGVLDYVTAWYIKAAEYIKNTQIKVGFVSTNSITQGEQVGILWNELFGKYNIKIHFAHRTFSWSNEASGQAAVHVVIIGFAGFDTKHKYIFEYADIKGEPSRIGVKNINPYLVEGNDMVVVVRNKPISDVPDIVFGNMPNDGGFLLLSEAEKDNLLKLNVSSGKFIKPFIGSYEFINKVKKWCLWLLDANPKELKDNKEIYERIEKVGAYRLKSKRTATQKLADVPYLFGEIRQPKNDYLLIPRVSSENRKYIPMGFFKPDIIAGDTCLVIPKTNIYHFGVLTSEMHMAWVKHVCGRLESRYRYSNKLVYNNFPWPENISEVLINNVKKAAKKILEIRAKSNNSFAYLYDPLTMPFELIKAHRSLDKAVDKCYRSKKFNNDKERIVYLFELWEKMISKNKYKKKESRIKPENIKITIYQMPKRTKIGTR